MKMHFTMVISGNDEIEKKFEEAIKSNPSLHLDMIRSFAQTIMLTFRFNETDNISIDSFRAGKIEENLIQKEIDKKVEN